MYGPTHGKPMTEDMPYAATTRKGRTRAQMARRSAGRTQTGQSTCCHWTGFRLLWAKGLTFGHGRTGLLPGTGGESRPDYRQNRPASHAVLYPRHRQRVGHSGRTGRGIGTGMAPARSGNGHERASSSRRSLSKPDRNQKSRSHPSFWCGPWVSLTRSCARWWRCSTSLRNPLSSTTASSTRPLATMPRRWMKPSNRRWTGFARIPSDGRRRPLPSRSHLADGYSSRQQD